MTQETKNQSGNNQHIFPPCYFPPVQWFIAWYRADNPVLDPWSWYQKQQLTSRTWIKGPERAIALHIPVERRSKKAAIIEKKVSFQENWRQTHWRSLQNFYRNSPYFLYYEKTLETFYEQEYPSLIDWSRASIEFSLECLALSKTLAMTESYAEEDQCEVDWRREFPGKPSVLPRFSFEEYTQVYEGFSPGLSILDLIFSTGPEAIMIIKRGLINKRP